MSGGMYDSSKTRVAPVFNALARGKGQWPRRLLALAQEPLAAIDPTLDLAFQRGFWGATEKGLDPPISLLSWLIRHISQPMVPTTIDDRRQKLLARDAATIQAALRELRNCGQDRAWNVFEGQTFPDALIETPDALIVVEGKRTEPGPTTATTWMRSRHQIWRHIDAAWEIRGRRQVFGLFVVQGQPQDGAVPAVWQQAVEDARRPAVLEQSFPHRGRAELEQIVRCLLGVTTWQRVCTQFGLDYAALPQTVADLPASEPVPGRTA